ncbi:acyltransferase [Adhaeretor mobilis]|nr:acyltransferase [Adhaeretor mobilis]
MAFWVGSKGTLDIGDGCGLSNSTIVCIDKVSIGAETFIGGGCEIYDTDFHQLDPDDRIANRGHIGHGPISIGPRAFIGSGSTILKNVTVGEGAVIGAGSVVTKPVPPFEIWAGVPARFIRRV